LFIAVNNLASYFAVLSVSSVAQTYRATTRWEFLTCGKKLTDSQINPLQETTQGEELKTKID